MSGRVCPVCRAPMPGRHAPDCLYRTRSADRRGCGLLLLPYLALALAAAGVVTYLGDWPQVLEAIHALAHSLAPGLIGP